MALFSLVAIPLMACLNRLRGGGFGASNIPGHPRYVVWLLVGALCALIGYSLIGAAIAAACYLAWSFLPWGFLMCFGKHTPDREMSWLESLCLRASGGNYYIGLGLLHAIGLTPAALLISPFAVLMPPLIVGAYATGWATTPKAPILTAELLVGALWGVLIAIGS